MEYSNILKAKIWKLALTRTPNCIRPRGGVLTLTDPRGVTSGGLSLGSNPSGGIYPGGFCGYPVVYISLFRPNYVSPFTYLHQRTKTVKLKWHPKFCNCYEALRVMLNRMWSVVEDWRNMPRRPHKLVKNKKICSAKRIASIPVPGSGILHVVCTWSESEHFWVTDPQTDRTMDRQTHIFRAQKQYPPAGL